jgi:type I restriction enzyme S subunit
VATDYVFHFLKSTKGQNMLGLGATAVTQANINAETIKDLSIPLPPLDEQREIVRRVQTLFKNADVLEARYGKAKAYIDNLTQSILARAFRGELVPQDPNDEPASALIQRRVVPGS